MSLRTSFLTLGGADKNNWTMLTHPDLKDGDAYLFTSTIHSLLVYNGDGTKLFKTDLKTITFLAELPVSYPDGIYYHHSENRLLLIDKGSDQTTAYVSTDTHLSTYKTGVLPSDPYRGGAQVNGELIYGNGYYVMGGRYHPNTTELPSQTSLPAVFYSTDGTTWNRIFINGTTIYRMGGEVDQIGFGNNRFVAFGNYFTGSSDYSCSAVSDTMPTRWSKQKSDFSGHIRVPIIFCNGYFYHYTWNSQLVRSLDGITWTQLTKPSGFDVEHYSFNVLYYKGIYYILDSHRLYSTTDFNTYKRYRMPFESISFWNRQSMVILDDQIVIARENKLYYSKITELVEDN